MDDSSHRRGRRERRERLDRGNGFEASANPSPCSAPSALSAVKGVRSHGRAGRQVVLPWKKTLRMSWVNIYNRMGRFILISLSIAVVVAFLISSFTYGSIISDLSELARKGDVRTRAALEKVGVFVAVADEAPGRKPSERETRRDDASERQQADQETWLMILSCVLCVVVITNTMLMSVSERVSEIGTLKCLGALDRFIVRMFLVESVFIGVVASAAGVAGGYLLTILGMGISLGFGTIWGGHMVVPLLMGMPIGVGAGTLITVLAAAYPAYVAAKMKPVDAMRAEI